MMEDSRERRSEKKKANKKKTLGENEGNVGGGKEEKEVKKWRRRNWHLEREKEKWRNWHFEREQGRMGCILDRDVGTQVSAEVIIKDLKDPVAGEAPMRWKDSVASLLMCDLEKVNKSVNGVQTELVMKLGDTSEAFFPLELSRSADLEEIKAPPKEQALVV